MGATTKPDRMVLVDSLRGFALLGLFLVHCVERFELFWLDPVYDRTFQWTFGIFAGKAYALFALCFGLSFYIIMERARERGEAYAGTFAWRLVILLGFGILHSLIYRGDILMLLALFGFLLLLFDRIKNNWLLLGLGVLILAQLPLLFRAWAAMDGQAWALATPRYFDNPSLGVMAIGSLWEMIKSFATDGQGAKWWFMLESGRITQIIGLFVIGLLLGRIRFFRDPERYGRARIIALVVSLAAWLGLWAVQVQLFPSVAEALPDAQRELGQALENLIQLALLSIQILVFIELYQRLKGAVISWLAPMGRMTLTLYLGQSLIFVPIFAGFGLGLYDDMSNATALQIGIVTFALQMVFAAWWFRHFYYGPLEWVWRAATRRTLDVPFRRREASSAN